MNYQTALIQLPLLVQEKTGVKIMGPADVQRVCEDMRDMAQECVHVLTLNAKNKIINRHLVTLGLANSSLLHAM